MDLLVHNARLVTCNGAPDETPERRLAIIENGCVGIKDGLFAYVGPDDVSLQSSATKVLDAGGNAVLPGLVDAHTHLVFAGSRVDEFARRMSGEDYRKIAAEGGGIAATVRATRAADEDTLFELAARRARAMRRNGATTIEIKSGYGLTQKDELAALRVGRRIAKEGIVRTTTTFLGAHTVPPERRDRRTAYVDEVVEDMLPEVARTGLADACDVYIDDGAFSLSEGRRILVAAQKLGLKIKAHVGQFRDLGGAELVAELGGLSADHLESVSEEGIRALARAGTAAVLLPGAWVTLGQTPPNVAGLRAANVRLAIATDCNPGTSPCTDLGLCASLAVREAGLSLEEAVLGVTVCAAGAAGVPEAGRIAVGALGDLLIYAHRDPRALAYGMGDVRPHTVILGGRVVDQNPGDSLPLW